MAGEISTSLTLSFTRPHSFFCFNLWTEAENGFNFADALMVLDMLYQFDFSPVRYNDHVPVTCSRATLGLPQVCGRSNDSLHSNDGLLILHEQSFLISIAPLVLILPPVLLALFLRPLSLNALNALPAGPTPLLFALLAQYHDAIPTVYKYRLAISSPSNSTDQLTLLLTDKSIHYLLAAQLALSSLPGSLIAAGIGWGVGIAWRRDLGPGLWAKWRVPKVWGGRNREGEGFEGLRRRLEGDSTGTSIEGMEGEARRRTLGGGILDQFRGAF